MNARTQLGSDVAIVGAGIIGLSLAFELAGAGVDVRVYDAGEPVRAASWAAAGMLAPRTERIASGAMQALCEASLALYPDFVRALCAAGGVDPNLRLDGILHAAYSQSQLRDLETRVTELREQGRPAALLSSSQALLVEPALERGVRGAMLVDGEGQIDNRRLGRALLTACAARGVRVETAVRELEVKFDPRRVLGIRTELGYFGADVVINAAGAWAARVPGVPAECAPPVRPVKGQMLALQAPIHHLRRTTWVPGAYVVPRADGRLLVGASVEEAGDVAVSAGPLHDLLHAALEALPSLRGFPVTETWAGLRPATPDELPCIGPTPRGGYLLATGHYRNGILLAPITARLLAATLTGSSPKELEAFSIQRFSTKVHIA